MDGKQTQRFFLLQVNEESYHLFDEDRYCNPYWKEKRRDEAHGKVRPGDFLVTYFGIKSKRYKRQLGMVFRVVDVVEDGNCFTLEQFYEPDPPLSLSEIHEMVKKKVLTETFRKCGQQGFNIFEIDQSDFEKIVPDKFFSPALVGAEKLLEEFMVSNWSPREFFGEDFAGLELLKNEHGDAVGHQYDTKEVGKIDMLCVDRKSGDYIVVELKKGADERAVGQLARYMAWVKENLVKSKRKVSGIVMTNKYDERLLYAVKAIPNAYFVVYDLRLIGKLYR